MSHVGISAVAALVGDETRSRTLVALMNGLALPAGDLARLSNVSPATMSSHLSKLVKGRLLKVEVQGNHRYYRLAGPKVATLIETFATLVPIPVFSPANPRIPGTMRYARTCYRHLAGYVAVELNRVALERGYWVRSRFDDKIYTVTRKGENWLRSIEIHTHASHSAEGCARACLDWSERRYHLAGQLGSLLLDRFLELKWIARMQGTRAIRITQRGYAEFRNHFGLILSTLSESNRNSSLISD
jgi:DNA-binding transcriptional ArsR family regulator